MKIPEKAFGLLTEMEQLDLSLFHGDIEFFAGDHWTSRVGRNFDPFLTYRKKKKEIIISPIVFEKDCGGSDIGIVNDGKTLYHFWGIWMVAKQCSSDMISCRLVELDEKNLQIGGTYFHTRRKINADNIKDLSQYCKYLGNGEHVSWSHEGIIFSRELYFKWYECVEI